ncbi:hypothetical protein PI125_g22822 [Phytophthora idaei]|nr:hypothetical protein PI125_g22822 [Phytophthora idaei]KAG3129475.1 hypothetical protein PI126_g20957 [Phytophthora idaei]
MANRQFFNSETCSRQLEILRVEPSTAAASCALARSHCLRIYPSTLLGKLLSYSLYSSRSVPLVSSTGVVAAALLWAIFAAVADSGLLHLQIHLRCDCCEPALLRWRR